MIIENAYAKINLTLDVYPKRDDGYHDLKSVMQSVSLCDTVTMRRSDGIFLTCSDKSLPCDERNLAYKAAKLFFEYTGAAGGVLMHLEKHIPSPAGLGGGSSDAAAVFRGLNKLYGTGLTFEEMRKAVAAIGSDTSFCIEGGTALCEGRGENVTALKHLGVLYYVICIKGEGLPTPRVFKLFDEKSEPSVYTTEKLIEKIENGALTDAVKCFSNTLEAVSILERPAISELKSKLMNCGALFAQMSGSGPSVFGVFLNETDAGKAASQLRFENVFARVCTAVSAEKLS